MFVMMMVMVMMMHLFWISDPLHFSN